MGQSSRMLLFLISVLMLLAITCSAGMEANDLDSDADSENEEEPVDTSESSSPSELSPNSTNGVTYFVRPDGGTHEQCTGTVDAPYTGGGNNQPCSWDHPFRALPPEGPPRIVGGDTLIIGSGRYMMGFGAPGADVCDSDYPWDCFMPPVPSGSPNAPTRILGAGWNKGCSNPPELWGTERAYYIFNLDGSSSVEVACLEITDHLGCVEDHTGGLACERENFPFGEWAETGLFAADSSKVTLRDLNIHGLSNRGIHAGRLSDWTIENVRLAANGYAGWDGDLDEDDANSGTLNFSRFKVEWNGCVETYPGLEPAGCWAQTAGGYGDGLGTGETGGTWIFEDSAFLHNTSDGLDLLYTRQENSNVIIKRTIAEGNAGNQIKTTGQTQIENVIAVGNCGFFEGKPFTYLVDFCRAGGNTLSLYPHPGNQLSIVNSTITGHGDCLIISECGEGGACNGSETILIRNSILLGNPEFQGGGDTTCLAYTNFSHDPFVYDHDIISDAKEMPSPCPVNSQCNVNPGLKNRDVNTFDGHLLSNSPAINAGTSDAAPVDDFDGRTRIDQPDIGAYEYWEPSAWIFLPVAQRG